jgi:hypothetical protein
MQASFAPGLHIAAGQAANVLAYDGWVGRWSRLFVPAVISAAEIAPGHRVLDVSTGTGEAALMALPAVSASGAVIDPNGEWVHTWSSRSGWSGM